MKIVLLILNLETILVLSLNTITHIITYTCFAELIAHTLSDSGKSTLTYLPQNGLVKC